jgi:hypothetical protein
VAIGDRGSPIRNRMNPGVSRLDSSFDSFAEAEVRLIPALLSIEVGHGYTDMVEAGSERNERLPSLLLIG